MGQFEKLLLGILSGAKDSNIKFSDIQKTLETLGFQARIRGDHFIYTKEGINEILNL